MGLRENLKRLLGDRTTQLGTGEGSSLEFLPDYDSSAANFRIAADEWTELTAGGGSGASLEQYTVLALLEEQGNATRLPNGFRIDSIDTARLEPEISELLGLPGRVPGALHTRVIGHTTSSRFRVEPFIEFDGIEVPIDRHGAVVMIGSDEYVLTPFELEIVEALERHAALSVSERTESVNVGLVAHLQDVKMRATREDPNRPLEIDLAHLEKFRTSVPEKVGIVVTPNADGSLELGPDLGKDIASVDVLDREQQLERSDVLRVGEQLVLLHAEQKAGIREIARNRNIPARQRDAFLSAPGEFLDPSLVDLDISFSVRVEGIGAIVPMSFVEAQKSGIDWLIEASTIHAPESLTGLVDTFEGLDDVREKVAEARHHDQTKIVYDEKVIDISDVDRTDDALARAARKVAARSSEQATSEPAGASVQVGMHIAESHDHADALRRLADRAAMKYVPDLSGLKRTPFPHQTVGIAWAAGMMAASLETEEAEVTIQGALLADDMGLGKTFMTLVALRDFAIRQRRLSGAAKPILAVLPLSLIENWEDELTSAFDDVPFKDVVVLQTSRDQRRFQIEGRGPETYAAADSIDDQGMVNESALQLSLRVGASQKEMRLDLPDRLVLTTYQNLGRFQLSLGQVEWGAVVFDEAQQIKNPEILASRAAKGLKADFKLLCTGTPVENSLRDIWNLMDTAQPDLLGSWGDFRERWMKNRENSSADERADRGRSLRDQIGRFMLRRTKEDSLEGLPSKNVHTGLDASMVGTHFKPDWLFDPRLSNEMPAIQRSAYDRALEMHRPHKGGALETIQRLKNVSLHPATLPEPSATWDADQSARVNGMFKVLDDIRDADEKAIIFVISKAVQSRLAVWLHDRYGFSPRIVNGETKSVTSSSSRAKETRKSIINDFEAAPGFNLIIMSPLAVGVGLTVVGANHAIHLERHWNPAKEAQATDRIYRIGQTRPVHVYLPLASHPTLQSFDVNLDALLRLKTDLKDAVVVPGEVENEMMHRMGLADGEKRL